jgi:peptide/nickel transport system ATP-binding protein
MTALLHVDSLCKRYALTRALPWRPAETLEALAGVSLQVREGHSVGIVGESGSGKSTLARCVMALETPSSGAVRMMGVDLHQLPPGELRRARRHFQMIFQDPYGSLDPRMRIGRTIGEPLAALPATDRPSRRDMDDHVREALLAVGLTAADAQRFPHEFSGGQRQRIAIARAIINRPRLIVADEPVSALDVSVQAQVLNLLMDLQDRFGISYLFISHDLAVVQHVCDEVAVLQHGRIVEYGPPHDLFARPAHPYTEALVKAVPDIRF